MNSRKLVIRFSTALLSVALSHTAAADVLELTDKEVWINVIAEFTTIDFTGFEDGTFITDQYADLGVTFTDGNDNIQETCSFVNDCFGLDGNEAIDIVFDSHQTYIAADFPGDLQIDIYDGDQLLSTSIFIGGGTGFFLGLISTEPFDVVVFSDPIFDDVNIDDLHFGFLPPGDIDQDGVVGTADLLMLLEAWGDVCPDPCPSDITGDDETDIEDMLALLASWGPCDDCNLPGACSGDSDDNCIINTIDLLHLFNSWGDCPAKAT